MQQELTFSDTLSYFWNNILRTKTEQNNTYKKCLNKLDEIKLKVNMIGMDFPDIRSFDFDTKKNMWQDLPVDVCSGVSTMGLHLDGNYRSILTYFEKEAHLKPHKHSKEYEVIKVLEGSFFDLITNQTFEKGDVFIIPKGQVHEIVTKCEECYMYILFSEDEKHLHLFHKEQQRAANYIGTKK